MGLFNKYTDPQKRKKKSEFYIKLLGVAINENLPCIESSKEIKIKNIDKICKRAIACLISTQLACDINANNDYEESRQFCSKLLKQFNVENELLDTEKKLFNNNYTPKDAINVSWQYECFWSLIWALGLIKNAEIMPPTKICDCNKAINIVSSCKNYEDFKNKTKLKSSEKILDMVDLFFRYDWACVEKRLKPETNIGFLNPEVVKERRKGLEWLISEIDDWNEISLDT